MPSLPKEGDCYRARDNATLKLLAMHGEAGMPWYGRYMLFMNLERLAAGFARVH